MAPEELLSKEDVAGMLRVSVRTLDKYVKNGKLTAVKYGKFARFTPEAVQEFLNLKKTTPWKG